MGGLRKSDLVILAARPSMGKTAFATNLILNMARAGTGVGVFSLETDEKAGRRVLGARPGVNTRGIRAKDAAGPEARRCLPPSAAARSYPVVFDFRPDLWDWRTSVCRPQDAQPARHWRAVHRLPAVHAPGRAPEAAFAGSARASRSSPRLRIPVIALSQLSRQVEQRGGDKIPILSDLRESGA